MRRLYWYDDGDDGTCDSWGESPEACMRRKWLMHHNYLRRVAIDYAAAEHAFLVEGSTLSESIKAAVDKGIANE